LWQASEPQPEQALAIRQVAAAGRGQDAAHAKDRLPPERADAVHDLLAHLAEQMIELHKARLAWTGWLIDRVVYRLYGLTQEEIAVVEGKGLQP
jgi:hypothetical protein